MKNLKLTWKLLLGFGTVLVMLLIAAGVAFYNMNTIQTQVQSYSIYTVPNNNMVWQMRRDMISIQRYLLIALTDTDTAVVNNALQTEATEAARIRETLASYKNTTRVEGANATKLQQYESNVQAMGPYREQIETLIKQGTAASKAQAYRVFEDSYKPILDENAAILTDIGNFQNERADQQKNNANDAFVSAIVLLLAVIAAAVIITVIITYVITKNILNPVRQVQAASLAISRGDLNTVIKYDGRDELGALADNMRETTTTLKAIIGDVDSLLGAMGRGDFTRSSTCSERYIGQFSSILAATKNINANLSETLTEINIASDQVSSGSDQVSSGAQALSQGATEQASSVEELSATITEISSHVKQNAENAANASRMVSDVGGQIVQSNTQMQELTAAMREISESSREIGKIIKTIEDIAFQTNILALNAAVEAARAGTAGKGFAVVADEVRNLASKSAEAAKNTTALIEGSIKAVENGTRIADETAHSLVTVVTGAKDVENTVNEISRASNEQAESIAQVTMGVDQISSVVQTNSATAEESAAASEELSGQAQMLKNLVGRFKINGVEAMTNPHPVHSEATPFQPVVSFGDKY